MSHILDAIRTKHVLSGSAITFLFGLGPAIPGFGLILGPLFTFGGGLLGGGVAGGMQGEGGSEGVKTGLLVTVVGGLGSSVVAIPLGTALNVMVANSGESASSSEPSSFLILAIIGLVTGLLFTLVGAVVGGGVAGAITGSN